ncbi:lysophospholipid acyltransferase family protein [Herbaspirillum sp. RTI4]|uniref:lysophospholipid acyltransferase family protein n=1 Tax=Herbaspirillum sp. RTI4 TaxID=3048640 RepID=UPI002AB3491F|nr:lysophospholipid acyltransferase family protein [Herbaspirillum sp. RTI4]MDY7577578.1 lysophospholipid acyltransferase family protein [Herbaspirillum sp. RTI4]MEA9981053.1 lysophospholipid acyltransferase family protein [Herbaspirillum sp. RTI4]
MIALRVLRLIIHLMVGMALCAFLFPWQDAKSKEARTRLWSARLLGICGIRLTIRQADVSLDPSFAVGQRSLIVCNHVSWLDIFVINSLQPCRFVAKSDIRSWPMVGWLCAKTGTIFISRGKPRDVRRIFQGIVGSIEAGDRVAFFPEGTTTAQGGLGDFHANLFEAAIDAGVPVQPYALQYRNRHGELHPAADFIGEMTIAESILAVLGAQRLADPLVAELWALPLIASEGIGRRELAGLSRAAIGAALQYDLSPVVALADNPPETMPDPIAVSL